MKKGQELKATYIGLVIYHQNLPKKQVKAHSHNEAHLFIPLKGDIWLDLDTGRTRIPPGKMFYLAPKQKHAFDSSSEQGERLIVQFKNTFKENRLLSASNLIKEVLFHLLIKESTKGLGLFKEALKDLLNEEITMDVSQFHTKAKDQRVLKAIELMDSDLECKISELAIKCGTTTKTLNRLFLSDLNCSPKQIQILFRIEKAKTLLKAGHLNITEVAYAVGFNSISQFIANFRNITGALPSEFK